MSSSDAAQNDKKGPGGVFCRTGEHSTGQNVSILEVPAVRKMVQVPLKRTNGTQPASLFKTLPFAKVVSPMGLPSFGSAGCSRRGRSSMVLTWAVPEQQGQV